LRCLEQGVALSRAGFAVAEKQQDPVAEGGGEIDVVGREDRRRAAARRVADAVEQLLLVRQVEVVGRFVEQQKARCLDEQRSKCQAPGFAARQGAHRAGGERRQPGTAQRQAGQREIARPFHLPRFEVRMAADQHRLQYRGVEGRGQPLRQHAEPAGDGFARQGRERLAIQQDGAALRSGQAGQGFK